MRALENRGWQGQGRPEMKKWEVRIPEETETGKNAKGFVFVIEIAQRSE